MSFQHDLTIASYHAFRVSNCVTIVSMNVMYSEVTMQRRIMLLEVSSLQNMH